MAARPEFDPSDNPLLIHDQQTPSMARLGQTVVATGCSSGLGFEAIKQLLMQTEPYKFILGARDTKRTQAAFDEVHFDAMKHTVTILPLQLSDLKSVKSFAQQTLDRLATDKQQRLDYLLLNAASSMGTQKPGSTGSKWSEAYITNHLSQHYLVHLLRNSLVSSRSRIVFVSSGAIRSVTDTSTLDSDMKDGSGLEGMNMYPKTKFIQLLGAHWWRRELDRQCRVIAVSPGFIPGTGLGRDAGFTMPPNLPDAKSVPEGAENVLRALTKDDFPSDPEQIFLTSWGEWWPKDVYAPSLDQQLQKRWCLSKEEIEREEL